MANSPTRQVLVLGDNDRAGLATVRSLGRAGLQVHLAAFEPTAVTRRSRYVHRIHRLGHPLQDPDRFVTRLLALLRRQRFDLAVPTSDKALVPLMPWRSALAELTQFAAPDQAAFEATYYKHVTVAVARRIGIAIPRTQIIHGPGALDRLVLPDDYPVVLKPSCSIVPGVVGRSEVRVVHSEEELRDRLPGLAARGPVLIQEFCPGHGIGINVLAKAGELVAAFQHRRVHEPVAGGASSYRVSMPLSAELLDAARRFCRELRWTGPAMLEFKEDPATGRVVLMEVNGRLWGSLALAIQAGVDFPRLLYDMLVLGRATPTFTYRVPYYVRHTIADVDWLFTAARSPAGREMLRRTCWRQEIGHVLHRREGHDLEALDDPLPAAIAWLEMLQDKATKLQQRWQTWRCQRQAARRARDRQGLQHALATARSVLFVCHGNINRSAFAEKKLRELLGDRPVTIASAGLLPEAGRATGIVSRTVAAELGIDLARHRSVVLTAGQLDAFDLVFYMEASHLRSIRQLNPRALAKCYPLSALESSAGAVAISDPDGKGRPAFEETYGRIAGCVEELAGCLNGKAA
jgi:predicted ATP-grasp superfamily ATP-dependent carboligase/protein-tyrosine-phosphatase